LGEKKRSPLFRSKEKGPRHQKKNRLWPRYLEERGGQKGGGKKKGTLGPLGGEGGCILQIAPGKKHSMGINQIKGGRRPIKKKERAKKERNFFSKKKRGGLHYSEFRKD